MIDKSDSTHQWYRANADAFVAATFKLDVSRIRERFTAMVPTGGVVLDLGSGSGRDSAAFLEAGYDLTAVDPSVEMCRATASRIGYERVVCCKAQEIAWKETFDGIWAMSSLLHVPRVEMADTVSRLAQALKPGGALYMSFRKGVGEASENGRHYTDYTTDRLATLISSTEGVVLRSMWETIDVLRPERVWVNCLVQKVAPASPC